MLERNGIHAELGLLAARRPFVCPFRKVDEEYG